MATENAYDVVVIGSGTGGYVAAIRAAQLGLRTAVVERAPTLGGTCLNWGCIPTKALLEHAHALKVAQEWKDWGLTIGQAAIGIDMAQVQARKDKIVKGLTGGIELLFKKNKIDWIKGSGRLAGKGRVEVTEGQAQMLRRRAKSSSPPARSRAAFPGIDDRSKADHHERRSHRAEGDPEVDRDPRERRRRRRVRVDLPALRQRGDDRRAPAAARADRRRGRVGRAREVFQAAGHQGADGHEGVRRQGRRRLGVEIEAQTPDGTATQARCRIPARRDRPRSGDAGPRRARKPGCGSSAATSTSTRASRPACLAFRRSATSSRSTRPAIRSSRTCRRPRASRSRSGLPGRSSRPINYDQVPGCTYCDPEIGSVGLTEREARERGYDVRIGTFKFGVLARARIANEIEGFVKIVADRKYDEILGVHMIGPRATELVAEATLAAAPRMHGRGTDPHDPRAPDDVGGGGRGRARGARRGDSCIGSSQLSASSCQPER